LTIEQIYYQGVEHNPTDTSQQAQLLSTDPLVPSPILEEELGVGTSPPPENLEVTSPNQHPGTPVEGLEEDKSREGDDRDNVEDPSLDDQVDQYIMVPNEQHFESGHQSNPALPSSKDVPPAANILASSTAMSREELKRF